MTSAEGRRAVAIGGGTGLPLVLRALLDLGFDTAAIVTMADDGGSSGLLRRELGMLPPGDVRNCLVALSDPVSLPARLFQYRFAHGEGLAGHALGNLVIAALADLSGGFPQAIEAAGQLLGVRGRVLPSTLEDVVLHAEDRLGRPVSGQANIAVSTAAIAHVVLEPHSPPAYGPAIEAIDAADVIVVAPGSLFTSLIPNFLVAGIAQAVRRSHALRVYVCNVANQRGETCGFDAADHVRALIAHGLDDALDVALVHELGQVPSAGGSDFTNEGDSVEPVAGGPEVRAAISKLGLRVVAAELADTDRPTHHDPQRLEAALADVFAAESGRAV